MAFNVKQFKSLVVETLRLYGQHSSEAVSLLLGTAAQESLFGTYLKQVNGPALGALGMEPETEKSLWVHYLSYRPDKVDAIKKHEGINGPNPKALLYNLSYQIIMARYRYIIAPGKLPAAYDIKGQAAYWKRYYNTLKGAGTVDQYMANYKKYVGEI